MNLDDWWNITMSRLRGSTYGSKEIGDPHWVNIAWPYHSDDKKIKKKKQQSERKRIHSKKL